MRSETIPSSRITPDPSDSQLLLFSSLTHLLQGSGQRRPDQRSGTILSSRITPDLQIHSFSSSVHLTHLLQSSGQRTPDTRSETIPSSRITPDLQIHSFFSSVLSLIFYRVQVREHLTRDQRPFLHPESLQILQIHSFFSSVHSFSTGLRSEDWNGHSRSLLLFCFHRARNDCTPSDNSRLHSRWHRPTMHFPQMCISYMDLTLSAAQYTAFNFDK